MELHPSRWIGPYDAGVPERTAQEGHCEQYFAGTAAGSAFRVNRVYQDGRPLLTVVAESSELPAPVQQVLLGAGYVPFSPDELHRH